jgi:hypothetical protein
MRIIELYKWDSDGCFAGTVEVDYMDAVPPQSTPTAPPATTETQIAQWDGTGWAVVDSTREPLPTPSPDWPLLISTRRYKSETSGITVNTMPIATDRDSQGLITGAAVAALLDSDYSLNWKISAGFVELNAVQILSLASAVRAHVQASFDREAQLLAAVADGSITAAMLEEGWPV